MRRQGGWGGCIWRPSTQVPSITPFAVIFPFTSEFFFEFGTARAILFRRVACMRVQAALRKTIPAISLPKGTGFRLVASPSRNQTPCPHLFIGLAQRNKRLL